MPYKLLSFRVGQGARAGVLLGDTVYDAAKITGVVAHSSVLGMLEDWSRVRRLVARASKQIESGKARSRGVPLKRVRLLAPVLYPGAIYCAGANYLSARDVMRRDKNPATSPFHYDWLSQKCIDGSCPLGPWIVPADEVPDPQNLGLKLWVNERLMQDSNTSKMIFDTAEQIAMLSSRVTLQPGDLVLTGTPAGVGVPRRVFLKPGDTVKLWIEGIGELSHTMAS